LTVIHVLSLIRDWLACDGQRIRKSAILATPTRQAKIFAAMRFSSIRLGPINATFCPHSCQPLSLGAYCCSVLCSRRPHPRHRQAARRAMDEGRSSVATAAAGGLNSCVRNAVSTSDADGSRGGMQVDAAAVNQQGRKARQGLATEYHCRDFLWDVLAAEVAPLLQRQEAEGRRLLTLRRQPQALQDDPGAHAAAATGPELPVKRQIVKDKPQDGMANCASRASAWDMAAPPGCEHQELQEARWPGGTPSHLPGAGETAPSERLHSTLVYDGDKWDEFYSSVGKSALFFKV
jgi:hypothetical protein